MKFTVIPDCPAGVNVNLIVQWPIATYVYDVN